MIDNHRHRPDLSLYEQVLYAVIQDITSKFTGPNNEKYLAAAKDSECLTTVGLRCSRVFLLR